MPGMDDTTLEHFALTKLGMAARIAICISLDSLLFVLWVFIAWGAQQIGEEFTARGMAAWCVHTFEAISQLGTLALTIVYVVRDLIHEILIATGYRNKTVASKAAAGENNKDA